MKRENLALLYMAVGYLAIVFGLAALIGPWRGILLLGLVVLPGVVFFLAGAAYLRYGEEDC